MSGPNEWAKIQRYVKQVYNKQQPIINTVYLFSHCQNPPCLRRDGDVSCAFCNLSALLHPFCGCLLFSVFALEPPLNCNLQGALFPLGTYRCNIRTKCSREWNKYFSLWVTFLVTSLATVLTIAIMLIRPLQAKRFNKGTLTGLWLCSHMLSSYD